MATTVMAQEIIICDICETSPVRMYCNSCATNLCHDCVIKHISTDTEKDHNMVIFKKKNTTPIFPNCDTHEKQICEMKCRQCDAPVCVHCIASGVHIKHNIVVLLELFNCKKDVVRKKTTELETLTYQKYEEAVSELETQLQNLPQTYDRLMSEISNQGEEWHRKIDVIINIQKQEVEKMKTDDLVNVKKFLEEMKNLLSSLRQAIMENNNILKSADVAGVLDYKYTSPDMWNPPPIIHVTPPAFTVLPIQGEQLNQMFGTLTAASISRTLGSTERIEDKLATAVKQLHLVESPESPSSIVTGFEEQYSLTCLSPDEVWVSGDDTKIKRFSISGSLQETVTTTTGQRAEGVAVTKRGDLIYTDEDDRSINRIRHGKIEKKITLQQNWAPMRICCTDADELLITMTKDDTPSRVVRYSGSTEKQIIQFDDQGEPLFSNEKLFIAENSNKDMICVSDTETNTIVALNQAGKLRFRYTGNLSFQRYKSFQPRGVVIDSMGHILMADWENHCIHIIGQQGHFIKYIDNCHLSYPYDLSLDRNNNLYVAELITGQVKVIKYLT